MKLIIAVLVALAFAPGAWGQSTVRPTAIIVTSCGTAPNSSYTTVGGEQRIVMDVNGTLCTSGSGGGGGGGAVTIADGADVTLGAKADAKSTATDTTPITVMSVLKQISASIQAAASSLAGTLTVATHAVTQSGTWTVQPGNTPNTTAWKVDGSAVTQPVSAASLPLPAGGSTSAKQPALGSVGSVSTDVLSVQPPSGDPCATQAHAYTPINLASAATTVLVSGVSAKKKYICSIFLKNNAANNVAIFSGSGSTCGTSPHSVLGGQTTGAGFILAANDGFVLGIGSNSVAATTTNADDLCIALSASSQVSGELVTVDQ